MNDRQTDYAQTPPTVDTGEDEINLLDLLIVLAKHKKLILGLPVAVAALTAGVTLLMPNIYTGTAKLMPPQQNQSGAAALLGQLGGGGLANLAGGALGLKNPSDLYVGMLKSRTVADAMIARFKLKERYEQKTATDTRKALEKVSNISAGKDGMITVDVEDEDPQRAADMANAYVEELDRLTQGLAVTEAGQRRAFFEKQLKQAKDNLTQAEVDLKKTQEHTGLIQLESQGKAIIDAVANLRAQIALKEVQLSSMRAFATQQNPDYVRTGKELGELRAQLTKLEKSDSTGNGDVLVPTGKVPEWGLEYIRKLRDVKYHETLFEMLAKQLELAKVDEARDAVVIQVIDKAVPSDKKSKPKRALITLMAGLAAGVIAMVWAFMREASERIKADPEQVRRLATLKQYLWRKRAQT